MEALQFDRYVYCDMYDVISNKYEYLKPRGTISMECDVDIEFYILRISLDKFLKETIEIQSLESESKVELVCGKHFLKIIERSESSETSFESFKNSSICKDTVHWLLIYWFASFHLLI